MIDEVHDLLDRYAQWVRDKSLLREVDDQYVEITTPYLDRHNDYAQIYVRRDNGAFLLTDGGDTIQDLRASGCDLETAKRRELLTAALNGFGVRREGDALQVRAARHPLHTEREVHRAERVRLHVRFRRACVPPGA